MTDSPLPLPHPRPTTAPVPGQRVGHGPLTPHRRLDGRMLVQVSARRLDWLLAQIDTGRSGVVLSGPGARGKTRALREDNYEGLVLTDPAEYLNAAATEDDPFPAPDGQFPVENQLQLSVESQLACGADLALTPTGYLRAEDSAALIAAAQQVADLHDPRVVFAVPADVTWLRDDNLEQFAAALRLVDGPKALMLGGQMDPLGGFAHGVANLHHLVQEVPQLGLMRTDLAAFGTLAHGAAFSAFGAGSSMRHTIPAGQHVKKSPRGGISPSLLYPDLMGYFLGETLAKRFAEAPAPTCGCAACEGRALDTFASNHHVAPALAHNTAVLMDWLRTFTAVSAGNARRQWWQERCLAAVERYPLVNAEIRQPKAFKVPDQLKRWAVLPVPVAEAVPHSVTTAAVPRMIGRNPLTPGAGTAPR